MKYLFCGDKVHKGKDLIHVCKICACLFCLKKNNISMSIYITVCSPLWWKIVIVKNCWISYRPGHLQKTCRHVFFWQTFECGTINSTVVQGFSVWKKMAFYGLAPNSKRCIQHPQSQVLKGTNWTISRTTRCVSSTLGTALLGHLESCMSWGGWVAYCKQSHAGLFSTLIRQ